MGCCQSKTKGGETEEAYSIRTISNNGQQRDKMHGKYERKCILCICLGVRDGQYNQNHQTIADLR